MNPAIKKKWLKALRSGNYVQGQGTLRKNGKYCCLGVLCEETKDECELMGHLLNIKYNELTRETRDFCGLTVAKQEILIKMNDTHKMSFKQIAAYIERYL